MIGIVKLFPIEAFLTREFTLFVWNDKLNNICVRVFLQKKEVVMNEVFTKVVKLCVEAKKSRWETSCQQLWIQHWLHSKWWPGRDVCKLKDNKVWVFHVLNWEKVPVEKRSCFKKKEQKSWATGYWYHNLFLRASWWLNDLILHIHFLSKYLREYRPPPAYRRPIARGYVRRMSTLVSVLKQFSLFKSLSHHK